MQKSPKDKQIKTEDESIKANDESTTKLGKRVRKFFFPQQQVTVEAETREEAEQIINKQK